MGSMRNAWGVMLVVTMLVAGVGCGGPKQPVPRAFDVQVNMGETLRGSTAGVHLVGVNSAEKAQWESQPMSRYWDSPLRTSAESRGMVYPMVFASGSTTQSLPMGHPIWQQWLGNDALWLFILADLPGEHMDMPGEADPRRAILSLDKRKWDKDQSALRISLQEGGVFPMDSPVQE